jgi:cellulose synthase/poly-beta-1,6-N-acetylglucosamine synthase-like glycosyltransferase
MPSMITVQSLHRLPPPLPPLPAEMQASAPSPLQPAATLQPLRSMPSIASIPHTKPQPPPRPSFPTGVLPPLLPPVTTKSSAISGSGGSAKPGIANGLVVETIRLQKPAIIPAYMRATSHVRTSVKRFHGAYVPDEDSAYWSSCGTLPHGYTTLPIIVPAFNESPLELVKTLASLHKQMPLLNALKLCMHVLIVLDGWGKASPAMQTYVENLFPSGAGRGRWGIEIAEIPPGKEKECVDTYVVENVEDRANGRTEISPVMFAHDASTGNELWMRITLLVKRENRRKHNSHHWFLSSFMPFCEPEFAFLTDCGTEYNSECMANLVLTLRANPDCVAATGRQRVMTWDRQTRRTARPVRREDVGGSLVDPYGEQEDKPERESCCSFAALYRHAQGFDYEASTACFNGAFALVGCLPVIPGPCGMYRFKLMFSEVKRALRALEMLQATAKTLASQTGQVRTALAMNALARHQAMKGFNRCESCKRQVWPLLTAKGGILSSPGANIEVEGLGMASTPLPPSSKTRASAAHGPEMKHQLRRYHQQVSTLRQNIDRRNRKIKKTSVSMDFSNEAKHDEIPLLHARSSAAIERKEVETERLSVKVPSRPFLSVQPALLSALEVAVADQTSRAEIEKMKTVLQSWHDKLLLWFQLLDLHRTQLEDLHSLLAAMTKAVREAIRHRLLAAKSEDTEACERRRSLRVRLGELSEKEMTLRLRLSDFSDAVGEFESHAQLSAWLLFGIQFEIPELENIQSPRSPQSELSPLPCLRMDGGTIGPRTSFVIGADEQKSRSLLSRSDIQARLLEHWKLAAGRNRHRRQLRLAAAQERRLAAVRARRDFEMANPVDAVDYYLTRVDQNPSECGMLEATLLLAEDRVLSYGVVLKGNNNFTTYVPQSTFYFEGETKEVNFLTQRRRWINGSMAGYIFILMGVWELFWHSNAQWRTKIGLPILVFFQLVLYLVVSVSPAIFALGLRSSLQSTFPDSPQNYLDLILLLYVGIYIIFAAVHIYSEEKSRVVPWAFRVLTVFNGILAPWMLYFLMRNVFSHVQELFVPENIGVNSDLISKIVTWLALANFALPIALSALHGLSQLGWMAVSILQFLVFLPSFIGGLSLYAILRTFDLT